MLMPDIDNKETMVLSYHYDGVHVSKTLEADAITLWTVAEAFAEFLQRAGFTYVEGVTIHGKDHKWGATIPSLDDDEVDFATDADVTIYEDSRGNPLNLGDKVVVDPSTFDGQEVDANQVKGFVGTIKALKPMDYDQNVLATWEGFNEFDDTGDWYVNPKYLLKIA